ncbi:hypothetical protein MNV_1250023 [Candidatus Methanoperedens nitroreducens]|uniref:Uncharacterized protein n=1 Tax=Candidatus Methanoperedens nitratireducens TaxID=1392998 RepID=A0A284VK61_9EURY|nr:hypothetical protein MNV_1250023 [Candidatus Methanoperedens nitroreducens]
MNIASSVLVFDKVRRSPAKERRLKEMLLLWQVLAHSVQRMQCVFFSIVPGYSNTGQGYPFSFPDMQYFSLQVLQVSFSFARNSDGANIEYKPASPVMGHTYLQKERRSKIVDTITIMASKTTIKYAVFRGLFTRLNWKSAHVITRKKIAAKERFLNLAGNFRFKLNTSLTFL